MAAYMEQLAPSHEEQEPLFTTTANVGDKSCGDWGVVTGRGGGYRWECLVTSQHVGRRLRRDGLSLPTWSYNSVHILPRRQSSPV